MPVASGFGYATPTATPSRCLRRGRGRLRRHPFDPAQAALSGRRRTALVGRQHVARRRAARALPQRGDDGPRRLALGRQDGDLSDPQRHRRQRAPARQLGRRDRGRGAGPARLERPRPARGFPADVRAVALRLARRAGHDPRHRDRARLSDGRPGPAAALELRRRDAARRRRPPMVPRGSNGAGQAILDATAWPISSPRAASAPTRSPSTTGCATPRRRKIVLVNRSTRPTRSCARCTSARGTSRSSASRMSCPARRSPRSPTTTSASPA